MRKILFNITYIWLDYVAKHWSPSIRSWFRIYQGVLGLVEAEGGRG